MQTALEELKNKLTLALKATHPLVYIVTEDEDSAIELLKKVVVEHSLFTDDIGQGLEILVRRTKRGIGRRYKRFSKGIGIYNPT